MLSVEDSAMNQTVENGSKAEVNVGIENATIDRDENLAKIEIATLAIIFLVTVLGNSTVLLALWTRRRYAGRKKLSRMYFFILHLSIADLITAFLSVLPQLGWEVTYRFNGGFVLCKVVKYGQTLGPYLSSYVLMATAIDRHQAICYPLTYCSWTSRRSKVMVWLAWATSLAFCIPQVYSYEPSEGTSNKGHLYERKLAALFALRLCNSKKQFNLLINAKHFDKWDDVVIILHEGEHKNINCFQLKHVTGLSNAILRLDMFELGLNKTKCICELRKLFVGYQKIKTFLTQPNGDNHLFKNIDIDSVNLILFTNMKGKLCISGNEIVGCNKLFETRKEQNEEEVLTVVDIDQCKKTFGNAEERDEFLKVLFFSGSQASEAELDLLIRKEFKMCLNLENDVLLTEVFKQYLEYIEVWADGKLNGFHALTGKHIDINLAEILISTLEIIVPSEELFECNKELEHAQWNRIIANKSLVMLHGPDKEILSFVYAAIIKSQDVFETSLIKKMLRDEVVDVKLVIEALKQHVSDLRCYLSNDIESNLYSPKNTKILLWKLGLIPLVIKVRKAEDLQIIQTILDIVKEQSVKIILITDMVENNFPVRHMKTTLKYLLDIENEHVNIIYNKYVELHGQEITLRELADTCPTLRQNLTTNNIIQILTSNCIIGNTFEYKSYHIPRKIPAIGLNTEILKCRTDILIIYGNKATVRTLEFIPDVDVSGYLEVKVGNKLTEDTLLRHRIILVSDSNDDSCYKIFQKVCSSTSKNVHLIKLHLFHDAVLLQWIRTSKTIESVKNYRISSEKLPKLEITSINGIVNILSADPGYGKTEMMFQLAQQQRDHLVVFIILADQAEYFKKMQFNNPVEHLRYFFYCKSTEDELQRNIFNAYFEERKILVILDGIDEISSECKDGVFKFIQMICEANIKIWITCRVCVQDKIENEVNTLAFTLNTFNETEQNEFLKKYKFTDDKIRSILSDKEELLEIPLYLYMLCESSPGASNMLSLCENFVQTEIKKYCEKKKLTGDTVDYLTKRLNKFIGKYAVHSIFPKGITKDVVKENSLEDDIQFFIVSDQASFGLIRKFSVNNQDQYVFIHKAIADYIAAKALVQMESARINKNLVKHLFDEKLTSLRYMYYKIIVEKEDKSALKEAVLQNNYEKVLKCLEANYTENIDTDFTTSLHLAAQWGRRHYYSTDTSLPFIQERCYRAKEAGTEKIVELLLKNLQIRHLIDKKDKLLSWTPIQYADHSGSLGILEQFARIGKFEVKSSQLLSRMPQSAFLHFCIKYHYNKLFRLLNQSQELNLSLRCAESENTLLHIASAYGNTNILNILVDSINIDVLNKQKETPLHVAAYGHENVVSFLMSEGSYLEAVDSKGYTPLHRAVKCGQEEIVQLLVNNGAKLQTYTLNGYSLLHTAAYCNHVAILTMLISRGANVNDWDNTGNLPLHTAVEWNSVECVKVLLDNTNDIDKVNRHGNTPLQLAVANGQLQVVKMLISHGAKANTLDLSMKMLPSIAKYIKSLVQKEFISRSGTDSGQDFEIKMVALSALRCCGSETEEMYITTNSEECGIFSDIVLHKKSADNESVTYLLQLKHQENPENITLEEFEETKGNYSLLKYRAEVDKLINTMKGISEKKSRLINFLNNSSTVLVLFTNRDLQVDNCNFLQEIKREEPFAKTINTSGDIYKLKLSSLLDNLDELHQSVYLFTRQVSARNIDTFLEETFTKLVNPLKLPPKVLQQCIKDYLIFVGKWAQGKLGGHCFLAKKHIISFLTDLLLHPYIKVSQYDNVDRPPHSIKVSEPILNAISGSKSLTVVNAKENTRSYLYQEIIRCLDTWWNNIPKTKSWTEYFSEEDQAVFYGSNQNNKHHLFRIVGNFGRVTLLDLYKCMWIEGEIPLILEITALQDYENILTIHELSQKTLKIVVLNRTNNIIIT